MLIAKIFEFGGFLGITSFLAVSASSTCNTTEGWSPGVDEGDKVLLMQRPASSNLIDLSRRSSTMLRASVLHALSNTSFGHHISSEDLEKALELAGATSHEKEGGDLPSFSLMGYNFSATNAQVSTFNVTEGPDVAFNDTTLTVHLVMGFKTGAGAKLHVKQPTMPHWQWDCWCFVDKRPADLNGQLSIGYTGEFTFAASVSLVDEKPKFDISVSRIARRAGGCELNGDSDLGLVINIAEAQLCDLLEGGANTVLRTGALAVSNVANAAGNHFAKLLKSAT
eukprot:TRINITY_DN90810_c0_g1_i1.p1 TRINITY_DN90810_c0_g1~~TRINITY_DN90810_c0_g1_i1.p1  ORF type:complete len:281 (+),score=58.41 TRINITY_DN90810_c0_g1_i1:65-907(+)